MFIIVLYLVFQYLDEQRLQQFNLLFEDFDFEYFKDWSSSTCCLKMIPAAKLSVLPWHPSPLAASRCPRLCRCNRTTLDIHRGIPLKKENREGTFVL